MNIFEEYIKQINSLILKKQQFLKLDNLNNFKGIVVESPPPEFNFDLSCNAALVLAKINKTNPKDLADKIKNLILNDLNDFDKIEVAGPGFLNLKLTNNSLITNINKFKCCIIISQVNNLMRFCVFTLFFIWSVRDASRVRAWNIANTWKCWI